MVFHISVFKFVQFFSPLLFTSSPLSLTLLPPLFTSSPFLPLPLLYTSLYLFSTPLFTSHRLLSLLLLPSSLYPLHLFSLPLFNSSPSFLCLFSPLFISSLLSLPHSPSVLAPAVFMIFDCDVTLFSSLCSVSVYRLSWAFQTTSVLSVIRVLLLAIIHDE
jgi:hypothetical protein